MREATEKGHSRGRPAALTDASPFGKCVIVLAEQLNRTLTSLAKQIGTSPGNMSDLLKKPTARRRVIIGRLIETFPPAEQPKLRSSLPVGILLEEGSLPPERSRETPSRPWRLSAPEKMIVGPHGLADALPRLMQRHPLLSKALPGEEARVGRRVFDIARSLMITCGPISQTGQISQTDLITLVNVVAADDREGDWSTRVREPSGLPKHLYAPLLSAEAREVLGTAAQEAARDDAADDFSRELTVCAFRGKGNGLLLTVTTGDTIPADQQVIGRLQFHPWRSPSQRPHCIDYDEAAVWLRHRAPGERVLLVVREWPVKTWFALVATDRTQAKVQHLLNPLGTLETDILRLCRYFQDIFDGAYARRLSVMNPRGWSLTLPQQEAFHQIATACACGAYASNAPLMQSERRLEKKMRLPGGGDVINRFGCGYKEEEEPYIPEKIQE